MLFYIYHKFFYLCHYLNLHIPFMSPFLFSPTYLLTVGSLVSCCTYLQDKPPPTRVHRLPYHLLYTHIYHTTHLFLFVTLLYYYPFPFIPPLITFLLLCSLGRTFSQVLKCITSGFNIGSFLGLLFLLIEPVSATTTCLPFYLFTRTYLQFSTAAVFHAHCALLHHLFFFTFYLHGHSVRTLLPFAVLLLPFSLFACFPTTCAQQTTYLPWFIHYRSLLWFRSPDSDDHYWFARTLYIPTFCSGLFLRIPFLYMVSYHSFIYLPCCTHLHAYTAPGFYHPRHLTLCNYHARCFCRSFILLYHTTITHIPFTHLPYTPTTV